MKIKQLIKKLNKMNKNIELIKKLNKNDELRVRWKRDYEINTLNHNNDENDVTNRYKTSGRLLTNGKISNKQSVRWISYNNTVFFVKFDEKRGQVLVSRENTDKTWLESYTWCDLDEIYFNDRGVDTDLSDKKIDVEVKIDDVVFNVKYEHKIESCGMRSKWRQGVRDKNVSDILNDFLTKNKTLKLDLTHNFNQMLESHLDYVLDTHEKEYYRSIESELN
jgi:hypothetical protein